MRLKVKLFGSTRPLRRLFSGEDSVSSEIEKEINMWLLKNSSVDIVEIKQSLSGGSFASAKLMVSIWYRDSGSTAD
jgi:hypothetical protein